MTILRIGAAWLMALGLLLAGPAVAQTEIEQPDGPWTHRGVGVQFPQNVGPFERIRINEFNDSGTDAAVGYIMRADGNVLVVTTYVYPGDGRSCETRFNGAAKLIADYEGSELVSQSMAPAPDGSRPDSALHARYRVPADAMKEGVPESLSDIYMFCSPDGEWLVKYRATWHGDLASFPDAMLLLQGIAWPAELLASH